MVRRWILLAAAAAVVAAASTFFVAESLEGRGGIPVPPGPLRLAELPRQATVRSPVTGIPALASLEELGDAPRETVHTEDFTEFDPAAAGWPASLGEVEEVAGRRAFVARSSGWRSNAGWVFPAEPGAYYLFERVVCANAPLDVDFVAIETAGQAEALEVHWPEAPVTDGSWRRGSVSFCASPRTRRLVVAMHSTARRHEDLLRWGAGADVEHDVRFDEVRLVRIRPSREQAIGLMKTRSPAPGADPELGIEKWGQFPPLDDLGARRSEEDDDYSRKYALYAPPPTELSFPVELGEDVTLRFSVCLSRETPPLDGARFEVAAVSGGEEDMLWSRELVAAPDDWHWYEASVDLSGFADRSVDLVLRTTATEGSPHPMWGNPVLGAPPPAGTVRNVILIAVDTLRADRLSGYGYEKPTSPNVDALAADGVRFDQVASNSNWTCPSFASIFTGVVPSRHGVFGFGPVTPVPERFETLAERFRARGWATHSIVYKAPMYDGGFDQGFDVAFNVPREVVRAADNLDEAMEWLERNADRRNFLFLHFDDPHQPFTQPPPFDSAFGRHPSQVGLDIGGSLISQSPEPEDEEQRDVVRGLYDGEVGYVDDRIGAFLDALESRGLYQDSVIAFVSDHGEQLWERGLFGHGGEMLFDEVVRVPLIVKPGPGDFARGVVVQDQVSAFDVMPTLLELAGIGVTDAIDARSLVPMLRPGWAGGSERIVVVETSKGSIAARTERWKYVRWQKAERELLYDLRADPGEQRDVAERRPAVVRRLRLHTLDYVLRHRPGHYVVAVGGGVPHRVDRVLAGVAGSRRLFGVGGARTPDGVRYAGRSRGKLELVAAITAGGPVRVAGRTHALEELPRYRAGDLERLLAEDAKGLHLFAGPPRNEDGRARQSIDPRQLEAIRAVGYVGGGEER